ncbi:MAG: RNA polymerase sigma factor [Deltaproteobacteria bacterium]|nr:RNA polymerase sigma factor [Deltaproteobacteria bacterium]
MDRTAQSQALLNAARQGDDVALRRLYEVHLAAVVRRVCALGGPRLDSATVADLVQETFARAFERLSSYREDAPFAHWLTRIATNVARSHFRRGRRALFALFDRPERLESVPMTMRLADERYLELELLHRALDGLSGRLREAILLHEVEGLSLAETAEVLEVPLHTAASRVRRAREQLRRRLRELDVGPLLSGSVVACAGGVDE